MTHAVPPRPTRFMELDALRGLAAVLVVVFHTTESALGIFPSSPMPGPNWLWPWTPGGHGVTAFFMISGFVISLTLSHCQSLGDFARARFLRLFPIFWVAMLFTALWRQWVGGESISLPTFIANITMMPSWWGQPYVDGVYWTLEIELQFYLLIAIIWRCGGMRYLTPLCWGWFLLAAALKLIQQSGVDSAWLTFLWRTLLISFAPYFGLGMLAYSLTQQPPSRWTWSAVLLGVLLSLATGNTIRSIVTVGMTWILLAIGQSRRWQVPTFLVWIGEGSYCIYLFHQAYGEHLLHYYARWWPDSPGWVTLWVLATCLSTALLAHWGIERPIAQWRRQHRQPSQPSPLAQG